MGLMLGGCSMGLDPLTPVEHQQRVSSDLQAMFDAQEPVTRPISLYEAMARAVKYNLDHRLKLVETAHGMGQFSLAQSLLLPTMSASGGYNGRNNFSGSSSRSLTTGAQSLETSTSQDRDRITGDLGITWNILDFGVSYFRAKQQADRALIIMERRRKVMQSIIQDVRGAYWRAMAAERNLGRINPMMNRVRKAIQQSREVGQAGLSDPLETLVYRRELVTMLRQLKELRQELRTAKTQLAALMNLPPNTPFTLVGARGQDILPNIPFTAPQMEAMALHNRPELHEEAYQERIDQQEIHTAILKTFPGIEIGLTGNYDDNSYAYKNRWVDFSAQAIANLNDIFTTPVRMRAARSQVEVDRIRRLALSMAVISQVHIGYVRYREAKDQYGTSQELTSLEQEILKQTKAREQAASEGEMMVIRRELDALLAEIRRDFAFTTLQEASGQLLISMGMDVVPESAGNLDIQNLAQVLEEWNRDWLLGQMNGRVTIVIPQAPAS